VERAATALPDDQAPFDRVVGITALPRPPPLVGVRKRRGQEARTSALFSKVVQSIFAVYFLCKAQEPLLALTKARDHVTVGLIAR
jgi:hypothetical protein